MELRLAGKTFAWTGNVGIQDQRPRNGATSLVAFASKIILYASTCPAGGLMGLGGSRMCVIDFQAKKSCLAMLNLTLKRKVVRDASG